MVTELKKKRMKIRHSESLQLAVHLQGDYGQSQCDGAAALRLKNF